MRTRFVVALLAALAVLATAAPAALSSTETTQDAPTATGTETGTPSASEMPSEPEAEPTIALEVYCYTDDLDVSQDEAEEQCALLGEFGLTWEQTLDVLDAGGAILSTVFPQVLVEENFAPYPADGGWRAPEPVLPEEGEEWSVIECPFLGDQDTTTTNGVGQVIEAEDHTFEDRRHVVCYQLTGPTPTPTPTPTPAPTPIPTPSRVDTGGGGTAQG